MLAKGSALLRAEHDFSQTNCLDRQRKSTKLSESIAGRRGFVKADFAHLRIALCRCLFLLYCVFSPRLFFRAFLPFQQYIELQLLVADHFLDAASILFLVGDGKLFLKRGDLLK